MWFDRIDPRDPLQITDGVYGLLMRYFFLNNANLWFWALYGNDETKGWEFIPTQERTVELGGRIQVPMPFGEIGFSTHHRRIDVDKGVNQLLALIELGDMSLTGQPALTGFGTTPESRFGLDGKWDLGIGLWTECVLIHHRFGQPIKEIALLTPEYQRLINLGMDYTLGMGNGLYTVFEQFWFDITREAFGKGESIAFSSLSLGYPMGLLDNVTGMVYYDWENDDWYRFINWQRTTDRWSFYLMAFWNPDQFQLYQTTGETSLFAGKGFQFMVVFNH